MRRRDLIKVIAVPAIGYRPLIARAQQDDVKKKLIENTNDAVARGTFGSPTFFIGDEIYFGKDSLRDVEEEIVAQLGGLRRKSA